MPDFLQQMRNASAARVSVARAQTPDAEMRALAEAMPPARVIAPRGVIAEFKRSSPSRGTLRPGADAAAVARAYDQAGACAVSVLTEPSRFGGSLADLRDVAGAVGIPVMRKDFIVDAYQLYEARAAGADGVLLIAAMLDDAALDDLLRVADYLGMFALVECFDEHDARRAAALDVPLAGVNSRDLRDLSIDTSKFVKLRPLLGDRACVAESGIAGRDDLQRALDLGYDAALVGTSLMLSSDPGAALAGLLAAGSGVRP